MPKRFKISTLLAATAVIAILVAVTIWAIRPAYEIRFHNDSNSKITKLNMFVFPVLTSGGGEWREHDSESVGPRQHVTFSHNIENAHLDFSYNSAGQEFKYSNLDLTGRRNTQLIIDATGKWTGAGSEK